MTCLVQEYNALSLVVFKPAARVLSLETVRETVGVCPEVLTAPSPVTLFPRTRQDSRRPAPW